MLHATEHTIHESVENVREQGNEKREIESHKYFMWENSHKSLGASKKIFAFDLRGGKGQVEGCTKVSKKAEARAHTHTHTTIFRPGIMCRCVINIHCLQVLFRRTQEKLATETQDQAI